MAIELRWWDYLRWYFSSLTRWRRLRRKTDIALERLGYLGHNLLRQVVEGASQTLNRKHDTQQWWLDFVEWYLCSMTDWAEFWIKTARRHFPSTEIYLVTGGNGSPILGADFSAQVKVAARHGAGIRVTNHTDSYPRSFASSRLVASASRLYRAYFTTEEALRNKPHGVTARVFDGATSGAKGIYFKTIIRCDEPPLGQPTQGAKNLAENLHHLDLSEPLVEVAVLFPSTAIALDSSLLIAFYGRVSQLRDVLDFDVVDENMILDGGLSRYRFLAWLAGDKLRPESLTQITDWVRRGGVLIGNSHALSSVEQGINWRGQPSTSTEGPARVGEGYILLNQARGGRYLDLLRLAICNRGDVYPWPGVPEIDDSWDSIYATLLRGRILYYNATDSPRTKRVKIPALSRPRDFTVKMGPHSIVAVALDACAICRPEGNG